MQCVDYIFLVSNLSHFAAKVMLRTHHARPFHTYRADRADRTYRRAGRHLANVQGRPASVPGLTTTSTSQLGCRLTTDHGARVWRVVHRCAILKGQSAYSYQLRHALWTRRNLYT